MTTRRDEPGPDEEGIEELLRRVGARDEPSLDLTREVHDVVHSEWRAMLRQRARRRLIAALGIAASLTFAVLVATFAPQLMTPEAGPIATVARVDGHLLATAADSGWSSLGIGQGVAIGEAVKTDDRSRAALAMGHGLSVRLDRNTILRFASADRLVLDAGAIYVDSLPNGSADQLTVETHAGSARHLGTQYEVRTHADDIEVSVREGRVAISNPAGASTAQAGERVRMTTRGVVTRTAISPLDPHWQWALHTAPPYDIDNQPLPSFLEWVARETGRKVLYASPQVEASAAEIRLRGSVAGLDFDTALTAVLSTTQLRRYETEPEFIGIDFSRD